ncbi:hypothetical protein [Methylobacterium ajmalii]|jgi:chorismate-pyruvate lyase|uniref:hypothetical protein n=1 Tax=Methylobacterium ajmalii TaxID=2738439 RepID=UPI00190CCF4E|nr:hypothetical protein [Methylobacterium ajmalii]MBK3396317.1 hypothetical protein [Methylobacterium ajmalii]MBK3412216.1 hypothetical protein [Methylobacterium ajmalii]MBK3426350.1 hypothetical protein [Methylobacterium ajmalii]MBZ6415184.1 hypothetical protein [Methylobacterium sp.]
MGDLREAVRQGTLTRMKEALADVDARLEGLRADRARLAASISEVEGRPPVQDETLLAAVRLRADGALVVSAPGTSLTRIVAIREKRARAAAQKVAELVEEALVEWDRQEDPGISETD